MCVYSFGGSVNNDLLVKFTYRYRSTMMGVVVAAVHVIVKGKKSVRMSRISTKPHLLPRASPAPFAPVKIIAN